MLIRQIPNASSREEVNILLQQIKNTNDDGIEGIQYINLFNVLIQVIILFKISFFW